MAHRLLKQPRRPPTTRLMTMDHTAVEVVSGPRGVHRPAVTPHTAASRTPAETATRRSTWTMRADPFSETLSILSLYS